MENVHLYFVPGLAANSKIFEKLTFPSPYQLHYLEWLDPIPNESIQHYAKRMASLVKEPHPVLVGVSFGGIIVQEMKQFLSPKKTIIISSIKSQKQYSYLSKFVKSTHLYKLVPFFVNNAMGLSLKVVFGKKSVERIDLYNRYLSKRDDNYLNWSLKNVLNWKQKEEDPTICQIHGNKDEIFPIKYIKNCIIVDQGTHIMILNKAKTISQLIQQNIH